MIGRRQRRVLIKLIDEFMPLPPELTRRCEYIEQAGHSQPNAMTNDDGEWFYADNTHDALQFAIHHNARPAHPAEFMRFMYS